MSIYELKNFSSNSFSGFYFVLISSHKGVALIIENDSFNIWSKSACGNNEWMTEIRAVADSRKHYVHFTNNSEIHVHDKIFKVNRSWSSRSTLKAGLFAR